MQWQSILGPIHPNSGRRSLRSLERVGDSMISLMNLASHAKRSETGSSKLTWIRVLAAMV